VTFKIVATDVYEPMLTRAQTACYAAGSLKHLPAGGRSRINRLAWR
jgi:chemotaxis methyl-accepting protein methylase